MITGPDDRGLVSSQGRSSFGDLIFSPVERRSLLLWGAHPGSFDQQHEVPPPSADWRAGETFIEIIVNETRAHLRLEDLDLVVKASFNSVYLAVYGFDLGVRFDPNGYCSMLAQFGSLEILDHLANGSYLHHSSSSP
jgi:hypothetical protein